MSTLHRFLTPALLLLCSCVAQREPLAGTNGIRVEYASQSVMPGLDGYWDAKASTILLRYGAAEWTMCHEVAHASDTLKGYRTALALVGNPVGLERQMAIARKVADRADTLGGRPMDYWRALYEMHGEVAIAGHVEILAAVSMPWLAARTQK